MNPYLAFFIGISTIIVNSEQGMFPPRKKQAQLLNLVRIVESPLKLNNKLQMRAQHENLLLRKSGNLKNYLENYLDDILSLDRENHRIKHRSASEDVRHLVNDRHLENDHHFEKADNKKQIDLYKVFNMKDDQIAEFFQQLGLDEPSKKKTRVYKLHFHEPNNQFSEENDGYSDNVEKPRHIKKLTKPLPNEYNDDGIIYLTKPKLNSERKINKIMNKIVKYKTEDADKDILRQGLNNLFSEEELVEIKKIVAGDRDAKDDPEEETTPKVVYKFSDLVY